MDGRESRAKMDGERELGAWHGTLVEKPMEHGRVGERVGWLSLPLRKVARCTHVSNERGNYPGSQISVCLTAFWDHLENLKNKELKSRVWVTRKVGNSGVILEDIN